MHIHPCNPQVTLPNSITVVAYNAAEFLTMFLEYGFKGKRIYSVNPIVVPNRGIVGARVNSILRILDAKNFTTDVPFKDFVASTLKEDCSFPNTKGFFESEKGFGSFEFVQLQQKILSHPPVYPQSHSLSSFLLHKGWEVTQKDFDDVLSSKEMESSLSLEMCHLLRDAFNISEAAQFLEIVLKLRLMILGDTFSFLRKFFQTNTNLDFLYCWTLNTFAFKEMLFCMKGKEIQYMTDPDMRQMTADLVRGPISHFTKRLASGNRKSYGSFDPRLPESQIVALDIRSSFLWTMLQKLPVSGYDWLKPEELASCDFTNPLDEEFGYIFEVTMVLPNDRA